MYDWYLCVSTFSNLIPSFLHCSTIVFLAIKKREHLLTFPIVYPSSFLIAEPNKMPFG